MPEFVDATVRQIDERLRELEREVTQLERARAVLTSGESRSRRGAGARPEERSASSRRPSRATGGGSGGRATPGGTTDSVLAALSSGEALTATEVAAKAGLARPTVSTTLSKLAKRGRVQKAARGYRLAPA
jgi:sugar-specific transcriptional regulator TrmB